MQMTAEPIKISNPQTVRISNPQSVLEAGGGVNPLPHPLPWEDRVNQLMKKEQTFSTPEEELDELRTVLTILQFWEAMDDPEVRIRMQQDYSTTFRDECRARIAELENSDPDYQRLERLRSLLAEAQNDLDVHKADTGIVDTDKADRVANLQNILLNYQYNNQHN